MRVVVQPDSATARISVEGQDWLSQPETVSFYRRAFGSDEFLPLAGGQDVLALGGYAVFEDLTMPIGERLRYRAVSNEGEIAEAYASESTDYANLVTNPRGRDVSGTNVVLENLVPNPRGRSTESVTVARNLLLNPSFEYGDGEWFASGASNVTLTRVESDAVGASGSYVGALTPIDASGTPTEDALVFTGWMDVNEGSTYSAMGR